MKITSDTFLEKYWLLFWEQVGCSSSTASIRNKAYSSRHSWKKYQSARNSGEMVFQSARLALDCESIVSHTLLSQIGRP